MLLAGVILVAGHLGEERRFAALVREARPTWLLAAVALQAGTYVTVSSLWRRVLLHLGQRPPPLGSMVGLALAELFTDQAVPSGGLSGTLLVVRALRARGTSAPAAGAAVVASSFGLQAATLISLAVTLAVLALNHDLSPAVLAVSAAAGAFALLVGAGLVLLQRTGGRALPRWLRSAPFLRGALTVVPQASSAATRAPGLVLEATALRLLIVVLDAATLGAMLAAVGHSISPGKALAAFVIASAAGNVSVLPGGLGAFEAACTAVLSLLGVPVEAGVAATLLLRGFTFWVPMAPGIWFARRAVQQAPV